MECLLKFTIIADIIELYTSATELKKKMTEHLQLLEKIPDEQDYQPELSAQMAMLIEQAYQKVFYSSAEQVDIPHLLHAMLEMEDSWAAYLLKEAIGDNLEAFMSNVITWYEDESLDEDEDRADEITEE